MFRKWRENNERNSEDIIELWETILEDKCHKLGNEKHVVLEQVCVAALDCNRIKIAEDCIKILSAEFPGSLRVHKYHAMKLEALERYDEALQVLDNLIKRDETNGALRKRKVCILKAKGKIAEAIKELVDYLKIFMSDQEAWQELCDLYLQEQDYAKAAFCMEELILHNPHNHLIHQRYAEIKYTQGGFDNMELARSYFSQALKLNPRNMRALYGVYLTASNISMSQKCPAAKKKEAVKQTQWALSQIQHSYNSVESISSLQGVLDSLQIS
ncbi:ER membrane protein complex subunit 2A [Carabus blaptoides fortunei]